MPTVTKTLGDGTQAVLLTVAILEGLAGEEGPVSVSELARRIGTSKSRVFRHLRTLLACDYVMQHGTGGEYAIGPRLLALCRSTTDRHDLEQVAAPVLDRLSGALRHSAIVSRFEAEGVRVLASVSGDASIVLGVRPGSLLPLGRSAQGKVALAFAADRLPAEAAGAARAEVPAAELEAIRREGLAAAQMREGLSGLAAPVFDAEGSAIGTLALLNTEAEMRRRDGREALREAAREVSARLGHRPPG